MTVDEARKHGVRVRPVTDRRVGRDGDGCARFGVPVRLVDDGDAVGGGVVRIGIHKVLTRVDLEDVEPVVLHYVPVVQAERSMRLSGLEVRPDDLYRFFVGNGHASPSYNPFPGSR